MNYVIDYIGDGIYGVFLNFDFSEPLMVSIEVSKCMQWAKERGTLLYSQYIKEILLLELAEITD